MCVSFVKAEGKSLLQAQTTGKLKTVVNMFCVLIETDGFTLL
jgi:hypothetical protein